MKNNRQLIDMFCQNCVTEASKKANAPIFFLLRGNGESNVCTRKQSDRRNSSVEIARLTGNQETFATDLGIVRV